MNLKQYDFTGAECAKPGNDPEWWTVDGSRSYSHIARVNHRIAKSICVECPIKVKCLETALDNPALFGIWGGTNDSERAKIRALRQRNKRIPSPA